MDYLLTGLAGIDAIVLGSVLGSLCLRPVASGLICGAVEWKLRMWLSGSLLLGMPASFLVYQYNNSFIEGDSVDSSSISNLHNNIDERERGLQSENIGRINRRIQFQHEFQTPLQTSVSKIDEGVGCKALAVTEIDSPKIAPLSVLECTNDTPCSDDKPCSESIDNENSDGIDLHTCKNREKNNFLVATCYSFFKDIFSSCNSESNQDISATKVEQQKFSSKLNQKKMKLKTAFRSAFILELVLSTLSLVWLFFGISLICDSSSIICLYGDGARMALLWWPTFLCTVFTMSVIGTSIICMVVTTVLSVFFGSSHNIQSAYNESSKSIKIV